MQRGCFRVRLDPEPCRRSSLSGTRTPPIAQLPVRKDQERVREFQRRHSLVDEVSAVPPPFDHDQLTHILDQWLQTDFEPVERHQRRIDKILGCAATVMDPVAVNVPVAGSYSFADATVPVPPLSPPAAWSINRPNICTVKTTG